MSDITDDLEIGASILDLIQFNREQEWKDGFHTTKNGKLVELSEMTTSHLQNTIKYFEEYDTSPLKKELERRKNENLQNAKTGRKRH